METIDLDNIARGVHSNKGLMRIYQEVSPDRIAVLQDRILKVACSGCLSGVAEYFQQGGSDNPLLHKTIPNLSGALKSSLSTDGLRNVKQPLKR